MSEQWCLKPLGDLCDVLDRRRKPVTKRDRVAGPFPYYGATGVQDYVDGYLFDEPLVLVGEDGAKWGAGDASAFKIDGKCWVNNHAHVLRPNRAELLDGWLVHYLNYTNLTPFVAGLTVPKLTQGNLRAIPIPLPPLSEQRQIVRTLDATSANMTIAEDNVAKSLHGCHSILESSLQSVGQVPSCGVSPSSG